MGHPPHCAIKPADTQFWCVSSGLLAPRWRDDARGVIVGLTSYATKAHIVRAMLEAMCFQTREVVDAMRQDADLSHLKV